VIKVYQSVSGFHIEQGLRKVKCRIAAVGVDVLQIADPVIKTRARLHVIGKSHVQRT
jgi:hypothetical protein